MKKLKMLLGALAGAAFGFVMGMFLLRLLAPQESQTSFPAVFKLAILPIAVLSFLVVIAVHELGHVAAGTLVRFQFRLLTVGPFMWEKEGGGLHFKWNKNVNAFGGLALCLPMDTQNLERRFVWFAAGGPIGSLVLTVVSYVGLNWLVPASPSFANYSLEFFWLMTFTLSTVTLIVTLVPMRSGGFYSDGARIMNLLRGGHKAKIDAVTLNTIAQLYGGLRPRLLHPAPLLEAIDLPVASPFKPYLHAYLYSHYLDAGAVEQAGRHLEEYTTGSSEIPAGYRAIVYLENAWFEAAHCSDAGKARTWFEKAVINAFVPKSLLYRAEAALAFAEGNHTLAAEKATTALRELPKAIDKGSAIAEKEWLQALLHASRSSGIGATSISKHPAAESAAS
jgi:hypothetical protein